MNDSLVNGRCDNSKSERRVEGSVIWLLMQLTQAEKWCDRENARRVSCGVLFEVEVEMEMEMDESRHIWTGGPHCGDTYKDSKFYRCPVLQRSYFRLL